MSTPTCPKWLNTEAKREWNRVLKEKSGIRSEDRPSLAVYCQAWGRLVEHEKILAEFESVWRLVGNQLHPHPAYRVILDCQKTIEKFSAMLGFSPQARTKLNIQKPDAPKKPLVKPKLTVPSGLKIHA